MTDYYSYADQRRAAEADEKRRVALVSLREIVADLKQATVLDDAGDDVQMPLEEAIGALENTRAETAERMGWSGVVE